MQRQRRSEFEPSRRAARHPAFRLRQSARLHPIALRLEGRRNRPLTEVGFSFAVLPPGGGDPTPAEVKGGVGGKYLSTAYTFS